jgi:hypothetical protein
LAVSCNFREILNRKIASLIRIHAGFVGISGSTNYFSMF